jgi:hypothetical protein
MTIHCAFEGVMMQSRVEVSITDHLRDFVSDLENYKAVQVFSVLEDRNQEDCSFFGYFIPQTEIIVKF